MTFIVAAVGLLLAWVAFVAPAPREKVLAASGSALSAVSVLSGALP